MKAAKTMMQPSVILHSSILLLVATATTPLRSCCCHALSPLVQGSVTTTTSSGGGGNSINDISSRRGGSSIRRNDLLRSSRRGHSPIRPDGIADGVQPLSMIGGGSLEPEEPQQQSSSTTRWAPYIVPELEVPTITQQETSPPPSMPKRPKIVVFGASGRLGRRVLQKLLNSGVDMDVVAFVREASKLEEVMYEEDLVLGNLLDDDNSNGDGSSNGSGGRNGDTNGNSNKRNRGPKLQVVVGDVVSREDVYQGDFIKEEERKAKALYQWTNKAKSYLKSKGVLKKSNANNSTATTATNEDETTTIDYNSAEFLDEASTNNAILRNAISGSSVIISCLGTYRRSDIWTDYLKVPFVRVFRNNVSKWSSDPTHPYYVNYLSTKKILEEAEKEQMRRDVALREMHEEEERLRHESSMRNRGRKEEEGFESQIADGLRKKRNDGLIHAQTNSNGENSNEKNTVRLPEKGRLPTTSDRIKFIRISHLMLGHNPFRIWNVLTNILYSQLTKFEIMGESLMEACRSIDTICLRPGDLTDEERNENHTSLQLCIDGRVDYPSLVGREDVADVAVVSALTKTCLNGTKYGEEETSGSGSSNGYYNNPQNQSSSMTGHHYTWAMRWTGQHLSPPQGLRPDGFSSAALCFAKAIADQRRVDKKRTRKERKLQSYHGGKEWMQWRRRWTRGMRPFVRSVAVSIPLYATMGFVGWYLFGPTVVELVKRVRKWSLIQSVLKLLP
mmetsp:Transcript_38961/g.81888  ORF Transcript_38961/g.81888 Transcript_38961/m.81888 type:complete len:730 (+) Transcript_38961:72-2261(+)